jgi:3-oxoacyl-[acyl-carrier protein] reductase
MVRRRAGWIVNLASISAKEGTPLQSAYSASKGGVISLTKSLAGEVAADGIFVNCIAPTAVETRMAAGLTDEGRAATVARLPLGRFGTPPEVAALVAWIASPECSYTTGFCFDLSGGRATF